MGCCSSRQSSDIGVDQESGSPNVEEHSGQLGVGSGNQSGSRRSPGSSGNQHGSSASRHGGNVSSNRDGGGGSSSGGHSSGTGSRGRSKGSKLKTRINKPLKRHVWSAPAHLQPRPTVQGLAKQRLEFFETRVTGKQEVWNALRLAIEAMQEPGSQALQLAQEIVNAADVTLPAGDLIGGAYDVFGNFYEFPEYVLSDPINALNDPEPENDDDLDLDGEMSKENMDDETLERRRKEKGKAVANATPLEEEREETLRIRLSNGVDHSMKFTTNETVASIKRRVMETANLNLATEELRIVQMGKILDDHRSLFKQGWNKNNMLLGMIVPSSNPNQPRAQAPPTFANERSGP